MQHLEQATLAYRAGDQEGWYLDQWLIPGSKGRDPLVLLADLHGGVDRLLELWSKRHRMGLSSAEIRELIQLTWQMGPVIKSFDELAALQAPAAAVAPGDELGVHRQAS